MRFDREHEDPAFIGWPNPAEAERKPTWSDYAGSPAGQEDYALWDRHAALEELLAAAERYCREAPQEGDYAILILSLSGTKKPEHAQMIQDYNAAREQLRAAIAKYRGAK